MDEATEQKFGVVDDRLDHLEHRAEALEEESSDQAARRREWIVIALFLVELGIGALELWILLPRHA